MYRVSWEKHECKDGLLVVEGDIADFHDLFYAKIFIEGLHEHFLSIGYIILGKEEDITFYKKKKSKSKSKLVEKAYIEISKMNYNH